MEEFWNAIDDVPAKYSSSIYQEPHHHLKMEFLEIPLSEIIEATKNFTEGHLGSGGYAHVYKAELNVLDIQCLPSNMEGKCKQELPMIRKTVAIKKIIERSDEQGRDGFSTEIKLLTSCNHPNVVSLLGFCEENDQLILVYEYALNGSLSDYLKRMSKGEVVNLTWAKRIQICLDVAHGINYLHTEMEGKPRILHRDIKSDNILLDENLNVKVSDFGLSKFHPAKQLAQATTMLTQNVVGTEVYVCPEYWQTFKYKMGTDIYSLGVVLFEVLFGRLAYDPIYTNINRMGLAPIARTRSKQGTLNELIDPKVIEEVQSGIFTLNRGSNQDPFDSFLEIACQCVAETQANRPTMEIIICELQKALNLQEFKYATSNFSTILSATNNFSDENLIREGALGKMYKGQLLWNKNLMNFTVERLGCKYGQGNELQKEISRLKNLKHKDIISVLGHYDAHDEKIIIYEQAVHGTLDQHLSDASLTCSNRLKICLGVASALNHIHNHYGVIHCDISSSKIILDKNWEPKIYGFELSTKYPQSWRHRFLFSRHFNNNNMTPKYDVYCFGVLLLEVLCGRKTVITNVDVEDVLEDIMEPNLRKQMGTQTFTLFKRIAYKCLNQQSRQRPTMNLIFKELEEVLELQWEHENIFVVNEHSKAADEDTSSKTLKMDLLKIPLSEIMVATNGFHDSCLIGEGGFARTYKAELDVLDIQSLSSVEGKCKDDLSKTRKFVAIKRVLTREDELGREGFITEIELLTSCKHPNIVSLLGFCTEDNELILVHEYCLYGSLNDYLERRYKALNLTWVQRLQICLNIANGIDYLHTNMEEKPMIIHRDIKSQNILLEKNLNARLSDFGLSKIHHRKKQARAIYSNQVAGTRFYMDPEYMTTGKYKTESDTYSFGVVLCEVLSGMMAYDSIFTRENEMGLAPIVRRRFKEGTLKELIDPKMMEEDDDTAFTLNRGPNQDSFDVFTKIAYQCVAETQAKRPPMEVVIKELQNALNLQGETVVLLKFRLSDIELATKNFAETYLISSETNGKVYKAELNQFGNNTLLATEGENNDNPSKKFTTVAIKWITGGEGGQGKQEVMEEIEMRAYKHPNIVHLLGFCDEGDEMILVYEYASNTRLDDYLKSIDNMDNFTWSHRLHMCLEIAYGLNHLHTKMVNRSIIRSDIKSANILLHKNREAKIGYFVISNLYPANQEVGMKVYEDPEYETTQKSEIKSDIYSFGVVLFEIFCGRVAYDPVYIAENNKGLAPIARQCFNEGTIKRIMDPKLKQETDEGVSISNGGSNQDSLDTFVNIAYQCLEEAAKRPTIEIIIKELERALEFLEAKGVEH